MSDDHRLLGAALALSERTRGLTAPNPNVGCVIVNDGRVIGRGWTAPGGRPHAEAVALAQAGDAARGSTAYVTLEPCAHASARGPACAGALVEAGVARVVVALRDPDLRTNGAGIATLEAAGIAVTTGVRADEARRAMAGYLTRRAFGRPLVTLKLALSLDGKLARNGGESQWITGPEARAHAHLERALHEGIVVGRGTWEADRPALDVRLPGLEGRSPRIWILSTAPTIDFPELVEGRSSVQQQSERGLRQAQPIRPIGSLRSPQNIAALPGDHLLVEGGAGAAAAFLKADLVDRLLIYRAPILIGEGLTVGDIGLFSLAEAHGRWTLADARTLGSDRVEVYERNRCLPA